MAPARMSNLKHISLPTLSVLAVHGASIIDQVPLSVFDSKVVAPSGDKHNYFAYAVYWTAKCPAGEPTPWDKHDGQPAPDLPDLPDGENMGHVIYWVTEALAYYMFGEERYAAEAATLLRKWFIVPATKMNPNLNWAQAIRGNGKGSCVGRPEDIVESLLVGSKSWTSRVLGLDFGSG
ncbi:alginate lyase-domain-containing protein [Jimgerdemannia flammicorona]|uniref:Alginate lyase-domain-containing protein n=1 Tax=Jimgerdemannia flammicorona TaxID=994334 RepID=A0A433QZE2_9FUNG|nr:alginate lyase-domain-containing protein [Jimgerdemannia flammicorona]